MKYNMFKINVLLLFAIVAGCASKEFHYMPLPGINSGSPLQGIKPISFSVEELQNPENNEFVYHFIGSVGTVVSEGIDNELRRTGHTVIVGHDAGNAKLHITGSVNKLVSKMYQGLWAFRLTIYAEMEIIVTDPANPSKKFIGTFNGSSYHESWSRKVLRKHFEEYVNEALSQMVFSFTTDPDFITYIETIK